MGIILNQGQQYVVDSAVNWYKSSTADQVFQFCGNPGTGKSVVLGAIAQRLGIPMINIAPMAYTGAAAIVMRRKGLWNAKTMHSWLFRPVEVKKKGLNDEILMNTYFDRPDTTIGFEPKPLENIFLVIVDEASMVPRELRRELESRGIKIIATGDLDQLPPVSSDPGFLTDGNILVLTEIMRQALYSSIIYLSQRAKAGLPIHCGFYGDSLVISEDEVTDYMLLNSDMVLCGRNATKESLNSYIRSRCGFSGTIPQFGERVICRKNNWHLEEDGVNLVNGLVGFVTNSPGVDGFDKQNRFRMDFKPQLSDCTFEGLKCDFKYFNANSEQKKIIKNDKYSFGEKFDLAYAITTHLSQGSQFSNGMYFEEYMGDISSKLNYTGITRFSDRLIYVKPKVKTYY